MTNYYHLYADRKTVKELTWKEWQRIARSEFERNYNVRLLINVRGSDIEIRRGKAIIWIPKAQLLKVLEKYESDA